METVQQAKKNFSALRVERREIEYPAKCKSVNAKDKHKEKTLCGNPEVLFTDYAQQKEGRKKNNLIFFTDSIYIWKDTLCSNYAYVSREGIGSGGRLNICKDEHLDKDDPLHHHILHQRKGHGPREGSQPGVIRRGIPPVES
ncbi:Transmembrane protein 231 [Dissostichus eleginoides]|uniref:Transmembrane protein 231 n=1 Tax=Dissostichus eleginoides TaxID=100907 RepID=A0AAD9CP76_DISEL|nr:Transmembrane protein 231 [Dissostichus eleginoides]